MDPVTILQLSATFIAIVLLIFLLARKPSAGGDAERMDRRFRENREELTRSVLDFQDSILRRLSESAEGQKGQLDTFTKQLHTLTDSNEQRLLRMRETLERKISNLQEGNEKKLEEMRKVVEEKLQETLRKRIGESFQMVSENLERVQKGLGEMQALAASVGDLKKVLDNVKTRGTWGEIQLGRLLEEILTKDQYETNVETRPDSNQRVEFAILLPGREKDRHIYLPVDAKFPLEAYQGLLDAYESSDSDTIRVRRKELETAVKKSARDISEKYLSPPETTDFGLMYLPLESLYAEVMSIGGLSEFIQREYRVAASGPSTITALLNSLQMGFKTLAIEKRSSEVWGLLGAVKTEFGKFEGMIQSARKSLHAADNHLKSMGSKSRTIQRKLKDVEELPAKDTAALLGPPEEPEETEK